MRVEKLILGGLFAAGLILSSCVDDNLNSVGPTIQPEGDNITEFKDTFMIESSTVLIDSIYARTSIGLLGEFYDPLYGNLKSDYICEFYSPENFKFKYTPVDGKVDSINLEISYNRYWLGDSVTPMRAEAFLITKSLPKNYYTNINPIDYYNEQNSLGRKTYTARDMSVSDSIWNLTDSYGYDTYIPKVRIKLPKDLGQKFYDETINNPSSFKSQEAFNRFFPGLYVTNTFGDGNIIRIYRSDITIHYTYKKESDGKDSTAVETFNVTDEVIQMNRFKNTDLTSLLQPSEEFTYLKTPAGVFTRITIPIKKMSPLFKERIINGCPFELKAMPQENWKYALEAPGKLLLLPEDSLKTFFEKNLIYNNITSYRAKYTSGTLSYTFGNLANLIKYQIENAPDKDLNLLVIPMMEDIQTDSYGNETAAATAVYNYLFPAGVKLRKDKNARQIVVITTKYNN